MVISQTEAARKKLIRGRILIDLYRSPNGPMMPSTMELSMCSEYPQIGLELVPQLNYLMDRGYILRVDGPEEQNITNHRGVLVRITDKGQDVVEGTISDDGISLKDA